MKNTPLQIAIIGLDTSHVEAFTKLLHDASDPHHVPGGRVVRAYPGGSPDFPLSCGRVGGFTQKLRDEFGVVIVDSVEEAAAGADAILLESVDGRVHLEQFTRVAPLGIPVFIDKPLAVCASDAEAIRMLSEKHAAPVMSCSALRYAQSLVDQLQVQSLGGVIGADFFGPMALQPTQPGYFWYGIHAAEMLFAALGGGVAKIAVSSSEDHDLLAVTWSDGQIGTVRGNRKGNNAFGGTIHFQKGSVPVDVGAHPKPFYASLLEEVLRFFRTGCSPVPLAQTVELIATIEKANELRGFSSPEKA